MAALQYVDVPGYAALLLRQSYADLKEPGALMDRASSWLRGTDAHWNGEDKIWTFPSGAKISFGYLDNEDDKYRYKSAEFQFIGYDESVHFTETQYTYLMTRMRRLAGFPVPLRARSASNPGGPGHAWVKKRFVDEETRPPDVLFLPAKLRDNPHLEYESYARQLYKQSPTVAAQLLEGDWGAFEGAAYPDFSEEIHVVRPFELPTDWDRFECMDWGVRTTAWYPIATDFEGNMVAFDEHYEGGLVSHHAPIILDRRREGWQSVDQDGYVLANPCYADPSVKNTLPTKSERGMTSVEAEFGEFGIGLTRANNDRHAGFLRVAELLKPDPNRPAPSWSKIEEGQPAPQLYIFSTCKNLIAQLGDAPIEDTGELTGEAVKKSWERDSGHAHAALRYGVLTRPFRSEPREVVPQTEDEIKLDFLDQVQANAMRRHELYD